MQSATASRRALSLSAAQSMSTANPTHIRRRRMLRNITTA
nr:MAG TPA: hypothetical protein [Caudoviricetes sp.]